MKTSRAAPGRWAGGRELTSGTAPWPGRRSPRESDREGRPCCVQGSQQQGLVSCRERPRLRAAPPCLHHRARFAGAAHRSEGHLRASSAPAIARSAWVRARPARRSPRQRIAQTLVNETMAALDSLLAGNDCGEALRPLGGNLVRHGCGRGLGGFSGSVRDESRRLTGPGSGGQVLKGRLQFVPALSPKAGLGPTQPKGHLFLARNYARHRLWVDAASWRPLWA